MRYTTYEQVKRRTPSSEYGVIDSSNGQRYICAGPKSAVELSKALNQGMDCRFNCRAKRKADFDAGYSAHAVGLAAAYRDEAFERHLRK